MTLSLHRPLLAAAASTVLLLATACDDNGNELDAGSGSGSSGTASPASGTSTGDAGADDAETVDPAAFRSGDATVFRLEQDGTTCSLSDSFFLCTLPFDKNIPDISNGLPTTAQQVHWWDDGKGFLPVGGLDEVTVNRDARILHPGQQITASGATCTADDAGLRCRKDGEDFTFDNGGFSSSTWRTPWTGVNDTCGTISTEKFPGFDGRDLSVTRGIVDCGDALATVNDYLSTPVDPTAGNSNMRTLGEWTCSIPTAGVGEKNGLDLSCARDDGDLSVGTARETSATDVDVSAILDDLIRSDSSKTTTASAGDSCGVADRGLYKNLEDTEVKVVSGTVDCDEAVAVIEGYLSQPAHDGSYGASRDKTVNGWNCRNQTVWGGDPGDPDQPPMLSCTVADKEITMQG